MSKEDFDLNAATIESIADAASPAIPIAAMLQEAEDLYVWSQPDKAPLVAAGLDWTLVDSLPARTGACRYAQSLWQQQYQSREEAQREWATRSPEAYALRDELVHHFLFAYRNAPDLLAHARRIAEGAGHADMVQDLADLAVLGKANPAPLETIGLDLAQLTTAETLAEEMADLLARSNGERTNDSQLRVTRDKAYTYLKQAMDEIRRVGQYIFWRNDERQRGYTSKYIRKHSKSKKESTTEQ